MTSICEGGCISTFVNLNDRYIPKTATRVPLLAPPPEPAAITSDDPTTAVKEDAADSPAVPAPARRLTLALPEVTLPASAADPLRYYCVFVETPQDAKRHIYGMQLLAGEELAEAYIHHAGASLLCICGGRV